MLLLNRIETIATRYFWLLIVALILSATFASVFAVRYWVNQQFIDFRSFDGMDFAGQDGDLTVSPATCLTFWIQRQSFLTQQSSFLVWDQVGDEWDQRPGDYIGYINTAWYEDNSLSPLVIKSRVEYRRLDKVNEVLVTKQIVFDMPKALCQSSP